MMRSRETTLHAGRTVLIASSVLTLVLGSVHAFSVFLEPFETRFDASRASVSATYSFALVALTLGVLVGHRLYGRASAALLVSVFCATAAAGTAIAAFAPSLAVVWLGYSLLYGGANGLGYGYALQISAQANPGREGLAMGIVTACYALGAAVSPLMFQAALAYGGIETAMLALSAMLISAIPLSAGLMHRAGAVFQTGGTGGAARASPNRPGVPVLWLGYGAGVAAGLMAIGHATGIGRAAGLAPELLAAAPITIAVCNMAGGLAGGWLIDKTSTRRLLVILPAISAVALFALTAASGKAAVLLGLAIVGFTYGAIIAAYPAA
ncbi:MAG: MFS transporter, partial [Hyphomicrobiales bacterium]